LINTPRKKKPKKLKVVKERKTMKKETDANMRIKVPCSQRQ
jgi:hypothetical protein